VTACKSCGAAVTWKKIEGRWFCLNADGQDHWDACSKRKWAQVKATGVRFENLTNAKGQRISGYADSVHGTKLDHVEGRQIIGANYTPDGCDCGLPPWELCSQNCRHAIGT
jgi:hypothetical protein